MSDESDGLIYVEAEWVGVGQKPLGACIFPESLTSNFFLLKSGRAYEFRDDEDVRRVGRADQYRASEDDGLGWEWKPKNEVKTSEEDVLRGMTAKSRRKKSMRVAPAP